jgi:hypothetical protein
MTDREWVVLGAMNIAATQWRRPGRDFEATAEQVAETLRTDEQFACYRPIIESDGGWPLTARQVGATIGALANAERVHFGALVSRVDARRWRLTSMGARVLGA